MALIYPIRIFLYCLLFVFSLVLLGLTADRINYTTHLSNHDPLNNGHSFYDPIVAELLFSTLMTMLLVPFMCACVSTLRPERANPYPRSVHAIVKRRENGQIFTFAAEIATLSVLFLFWLVGAAVASSMWGDLNWCWHFHTCRVLSALVAFAWLGWITIFGLLATSVVYAVANGALMEPFHGVRYPRESGSFPQTSEYRA
ncbi:hypothetical protein FA95DRAFT_1571497 [Auriscalpium vulgare]|uniref:Uncharacterized protein n=1 Tax=Auriscalpium vulgare TaxID=40419 RepID=A0ACB8RYM8_9AGAM|nr:hypothetical protein FA95DRAFT_1571497 [Auriscalpium vulgare]